MRAVLHEDAELARTQLHQFVGRDTCRGCSRVCRRAILMIHRDAAGVGRQVPGIIFVYVTGHEACADTVEHPPEQAIVGSAVVSNVTSGGSGGSHRSMPGQDEFCGSVP